ncbi:MAG: hypothetical protein M1401_06425 [Chloroflexi bacterium]|nr:hypothetical protein [Chloroflexota bacterium]
MAAEALKWVNSLAADTLLENLVYLIAAEMQDEIDAFLGDPAWNSPSSSIWEDPATEDARHRRELIKEYGEIQDSLQHLQDRVRAFQKKMQNPNSTSGERFEVEDHPIMEAEDLPL